MRFLVLKGNDGYNIIIFLCAIILENKLQNFGKIKNNAKTMKKFDIIFFSILFLIFYY